jgi:signal transduction histidine kinase
MIDIVLLLTTFWFFAMYEKEQQRLRSIAFEHQQLQTISKMIATLNHEINTPLNSSLIAIQMLQNLEKRSLPNNSALGCTPSEPWVNLALEGLRQIQGVIKQIAAIEPEKLVEDDYHSQTPSGNSGKIYKVDKKTF